MKRKLYIINNGLKDLRGHYFETSVSIAESSRGLGLQPILASHVKCPGDIVPSGLEFHAAFTTDHWMMEPPPAQPDLSDLQRNSLRLASNAIANGSGFREYLEARFHPQAVASQVGAIDGDAAAPTATNALAQIKRMARTAIPRFLMTARAVLKRVLRKLLPDFLWNRLKSLAASSPVARAQPSPAPAHPWNLLLSKIGSPQEFAYIIRFQQDLVRLLFLTGCTSADHVFLPTAHARELCAIVDLISDCPTFAQPTFHLEFRHSLVPPRDGGLTDDDFNRTANATFFEIARTFPINNNLRLYTDSAELTAEYERLSRLPFGVLPIPFRSHLLSARSRKDGPICVGYYGDVRDEKGFHWLPGLVEAMMDDYVRPGRVRFLIQASLIHPEHEPRSKHALEQLKRYPEDMVRLVGLDGPLAPESYFRMVSETDLLVCPYHPESYRRRTSGTLTEAIAFGIPTVVPHGSWLGSQQPTGSGTTFVDAESFNQAVRQICDDYQSYQARARAGRYSWLQLHSPERLVRALVGETVNRGSRAGKVA